MRFDCACVIGAGPIGLAAALKLRPLFTRVVVIERRGAYTRLNVPTAGDAFRGMVRDIARTDTAPGWSSQTAEPVPLSRIEEDLYALAQRRGIVIHRNTRITGIGRVGEASFFGQFGRVNLLLRTVVQEKTDTTAEKIEHRTEVADFLVVAAGAGAVVSDPILLELGFEQVKLTPEFHGFFLLFDSDGSNVDKNKGRKVVGYNVGATAFADVVFAEGERREYVLAVPRDMSDADWLELERNRVLFERFAKTLAANYGIKAPKQVGNWQETYGHFMIQTRRARHFVSPGYPAVLVGDAAVMPNPQGGTGLDSGARMVEAVVGLLAALMAQRKQAPDADVTLRMDLNRTIEHVAFHKILMETDQLCKNLQVVLEPLMAELGRPRSMIVGTICQEIARDLAALDARLDGHRADVEALLGGTGFPARLLEGIIARAGGATFARTGQSKAAKVLGLGTDARGAPLPQPRAPKPDNAKLLKLKKDWRTLEAPEAGMPSLLWELWAQIEETYAAYRVALLNAEKAMAVLGKGRPTVQQRVDAFGRTVRAV